METKSRQEKLELCQRITKLAGHNLAKLLQLLKKSQPNALQFIDSQWVFNADTLTDTTLFKLENFVECCSKSTSSRDTSWRCTICEFPNLHLSSFCDICGTDRPRSPGSSKVKSKNISKGQLLEHPSADKGPALQYAGENTASPILNIPSTPRPPPALHTGTESDSGKFASKYTAFAPFSPSSPVSICGDKLSTDAILSGEGTSESSPPQQPRLHPSLDTQKDVDNAGIWENRSRSVKQLGDTNVKSNEKPRWLQVRNNNKNSGRMRNRSRSVLEQEMAAEAMTELPNAFVQFQRSSSNSSQPLHGSSPPSLKPQSSNVSQPAAPSQYFPIKKKVHTQHQRAKGQTTKRALQSNRRISSNKRLRESEPDSKTGDRVDINGIGAIRIGNDETKITEGDNSSSSSTSGTRRKSKKNNLKWECEKCGKQFRMLSEVKVHVRVHTGAKPFKCSKCDARFADPSNLRVHMRGAHSGKTYLCTYPGCSAAYRYPQSLRDHTRSHTGEALECSCGQTFLNKSNLNKHRRRMGCKKP